MFVKVNDWTPEDIGDYLPPYVPGGERWRADVWLSRNGEVISGVRYYGIIRDNQKLFDSTFG